jgi:hypothetical protein
MCALGRVKPDLSGSDTQRIKKAATDLLDVLKGDNRELTIDARFGLAAFLPAPVVAMPRTT